MLAILSTIDPENELFRKDYVKPKPVPPNQGFAANMVHNREGFFTGLPIAAKSKKKHKQSIKFETLRSLDPQNRMVPRDIDVLRERMSDTLAR